MTREQIIDACHFDEPEQILAYIEELEAKIAKLEGGVVAEFSEEVELDGDNDCLVMISDNFYLSAVDTKKISVGKQYTVTIKEKEIE